MRKAYNLIDHATEVEIALRDILYKVKDGEADMRGYIITHEQSYYNSFSENKSNVQQKVQELQKFVDDSLQVSNGIELQRLLERRFLLLEKMADFSDTLDISDFQQVVNDGEAVSRRIEDHFASMVVHEQVFLSEHEQALFSLMDVRRRVSIFGSLLAIGLAIIIFRLIREESALIRRRQELLQELNDNKDKFFSIISHDLKNPFTAIKGFIEMLNHKEYHEREEDLDALIKKLTSSTERFDSLLSDLLTWARLQMNALNVKLEKININELLRELSDHYFTLAESKNLSFEIKINANSYALADKTMTETIVRNLISNAVKFTDTGKIALSAYSHSGYAVIEVSDTGTGMDENVIQNLFQLGKVQSQRGTRNETGTGMGLILCKDMAERQEGRLEVSSVFGKGTTVRLFLKSV